MDATVRSELEEGRERQQSLMDQIARVQRQFERSAQAIDLAPAQLRDALSAALDIAGAGPLAPLSEATADHPATYAVPVGELARDPSWLPVLDTLRPPCEPGVKLHEWRAKAAPRPVTFADPGTLGQDAVQLHLEHPVVRRLLARFTTQGLVHLDLSRACLAATSLGEPRVIVLGRLSLYGPGAVRLHEEVVPVTARWVEPALRRAPLQPHGESGTARALDLLEQALSDPGKQVSPEVSARLLATVGRDIAELVPHLDRATAQARDAAEAQLQHRGRREAAEMQRLIAEQRHRITAAIQKAAPPDQLALVFPDEAARRQMLDDRRAWDLRLAKLDQEEADLPARIRDGYRVAAARIEPVGIAYLWPVA